MVLLLPWTPSRKNEGVAVVASKREKFSVITILVFSLSLWTTLQCVTSLPQHETRPMIYTPAEEQTFQDKRSENNEASTDFPALDNTGISKLGWCQRERQFVKLCGSKLWEAIVTCCGSNNIYEPTTNNGNSLETIPSRPTKSIVEECCVNPCSASTFKLYCNNPNKMPVGEASSSENVDNESARSQPLEQPLEQPLDPEPRVQPTSPPDNSERLIHGSVLYLLNFFRPKSGEGNPRKGQVTTAEEKRDGSTFPIVQEREPPLAQSSIKPRNDQYSLNQQHLTRPRQRKTQEAFSGEIPSYGQTGTGKQRHGNPCPPRMAEMIAAGNRDPTGGHDQQRARKVSTPNVLTSTIAPDVRILRLESPTDDEALYKKKK